MPKIREPRNLETLAITASAKWLCVLGETLIPIIEKINRSFDPTETPEKIRVLMQTVHDLYEYSVPCYLYDALSVQVFREIVNFVSKIKTTVDARNCMAKFLSHVNVGVSLSEVLVSKNMSRLSFDEMPKLVRHIFYNKLALLQGLVHLDLGSLSGGWKTEDMEPTVLKGVVNMKKLRHLSLHYDCTDKIIAAVVESCPLLQSIDLSSSKFINNNSIDILVKLENLRIVQLYRTSVSIEGYIKLLLKLPHLQDVGRYDELGRCLEYIDVNYPQRDQFQLRKFVTSYATTRHLQLLSEKCPQIFCISLFHNVLLIDLMTLIGVNLLSELKLLSCDFFADQLRDVLMIKGCNLTSLHLEHVDEIDDNALMYISQYCPDLKVLTLYNCELIESTSLYIRKPEIPPFFNLERLTLAVHCRLAHIEFIMATALQLKYIHLGTMVPTSDHLFDRILARNPLEHLEELRIVFSEEITLKTAYKLVQMCPNLAILNEIESWTQLKESDVREFREFVKAKNYDLDVTSLGRFHNPAE
jgi:ribonucleases P/MRP protein subunit RPP40